MLHKLNKEVCHECESIHDMHDIDEWGCPSCKQEDPTDENIDWDEQECAYSRWSKAIMTPEMEMELRELGILLPTEDQCEQENELVRYDLSYKMPELDEYGEPPW